MLDISIKSLCDTIVRFKTECLETEMVMHDAFPTKYHKDLIELIEYIIKSGIPLDNLYVKIITDFKSDSGKDFKKLFIPKAIILWVFDKLQHEVDNAKLQLTEPIVYDIECMSNLKKAFIGQIYNDSKNIFASCVQVIIQDREIYSKVWENANSTEEVLKNLYRAIESYIKSCEFDQVFDIPSFEVCDFVNMNEEQRKIWLCTL